MIVDILNFDRLERPRPDMETSLDYLDASFFYCLQKRFGKMESGRWCRHRSHVILVGEDGLIATDVARLILSFNVMRQGDMPKPADNSVIL